MAESNKRAGWVEECGLWRLRNGDEKLEVAGYRDTVVVEVYDGESCAEVSISLDAFRALQALPVVEPEPFGELYDLRARLGAALGRTPAEAAALTRAELADGVEALAKDRERWRERAEEKLDGGAIAAMAIEAKARGMHIDGMTPVQLVNAMGTWPERAERRHCGACEKETAWAIGETCTECWGRLDRAKRAAEEACHDVCDAMGLSYDAPADVIARDIVALHEAAEASKAIARERDAAVAALGERVAADPGEADGLRARVAELEGAERVRLELEDKLRRAELAAEWQGKDVRRAAFVAALTGAASIEPGKLAWEQLAATQVNHALAVANAAAGVWAGHNQSPGPDEPAWDDAVFVAGLAKATGQPPKGDYARILELLTRAEGACSGALAELPHSPGEARNFAQEGRYYLDEVVRALGGPP